MTVGIDPSYTRTGVSLKKGVEWKFHSLSAPGDIDIVTTAITKAHSIASQLRDVIRNTPIKEGEPLIVVVEYPILSTRAGANLILITSKFDSLFRVIKPDRVLYLPSIAVSAYTKEKTKEGLVAWAKSNLSITQRINHDEATAAILATIGEEILASKYKKSFLEINYRQ